MAAKDIIQKLHYNSLFLPKEDRQVIQNSNLALWNDITAINSNYPDEEIHVDHVIKDFGKTYGIDLELSCDNPTVQKYLDEAYKRNMRLPRFSKPEHFDELIEKV